ncbi:MAG: pyridoxal phosphate-dependent aminotransferase [Saprospiraceae bacterium]|nr:pyridoxal phosphate-dependent aminotransferase [Saprospiraceae bacterium]
MTEIRNYNKSNRLNNISYAIRGPIFDKAQEFEKAGEKIISLNIGNPAPFGFDVSSDILHTLTENLLKAEGYSHHLGIFSAREAIAAYYRNQGVENIDVNHIFTGNGVSELILMTLQAMVNDGDEILVPSPDYPLWTAAVGLSGGRAVHYICDESSDWNPDLDDIRKKISLKTKAIVLINPNNPTGAVYEKEIIYSINRLAAENNLIILSDEIYDKILFDGHTHYPVAACGNEALVLTFGGLSKNFMAAGFRAGWVVFRGPVQKAKSLLEGLNLLASLRLCANVPAQFMIKTALESSPKITEYISHGGRLKEQRDLMYRLICDIPGISCVKPKGALYLFPKFDPYHFDSMDDESFAYQLLSEHKVLIVPGNGFNHTDRNHFRIVFLPEVQILSHAAASIRSYLESRTITRQVYETV